MNFVLVAKNEKKKLNASSIESQYNIDNKNILLFLCQTTGFREIMYTIWLCVKIIGMREAVSLDEFKIVLAKKILTCSWMCIKDNYWSFINI